MRPVLIAPSILSADFAFLGEALHRLDRAGADWIHLDVMDGHFVPNLTFGAPIVAKLRAHSTRPFDAHLMVTEPDRYLEAFAEAGCDAITVHAETTPHLHRTLSAIRALGKQAGVSYNPATPIAGLEYVLDLIDRVLIMSVNPGFGGQRFIPAVLPKIREVRAIADRNGLPLHVAVDGGIDTATAPGVVAAGADVLIAGSAVFASGAIEKNLEALRSCLLPRV